MDKSIETDHETWQERNMLRIVIILVFVLAALYFVVGMMAFMFPEWDIPMLWMAFPVGPAGPPTGAIN